MERKQTQPFLPHSRSPLPTHRLSTHIPQHQGFQTCFLLINRQGIFFSSAAKQYLMSLSKWCVSIFLKKKDLLDQFLIFPGMSRVLIFWQINIVSYSTDYIGRLGRWEDWENGSVNEVYKYKDFNSILSVHIRNMQSQPQRHRHIHFWSVLFWIPRAQLFVS